MKEYQPLNGRLIVVSRGIKPEDGGIVIPDHLLDDSDVCTVEQTGETIIRERGVGRFLGYRTYIIESDQVLAKIVDNKIIPSEGIFLGRKCLDPEDDAGIVTLSDRKNQFVEILAVNEQSELKEDIGCLAYVDVSKKLPQKVEETIDDWLIHESEVEFITGE
jgi:hypothetical protein